MTGRRRFIARAGGVLAAAGAGAIVDAPSVIAQPKIQWRLSTSFSAGLINQEAAGDWGRLSRT